MPTQSTSREDIKKEVQTVLSMGLPSLDLTKNQQPSSSTLQKIAPGTPHISQQHALPPDSNNIIIQSISNTKDVKDEDAVQDTALAIRGEEGQHSSSGLVAREWVAHAAETGDGKHTRTSQVKSAVKVSYCGWCTVSCCLLAAMLSVMCLHTCVAAWRQPMRKYVLDAVDTSLKFVHAVVIMLPPVSFCVCTSLQHAVVHCAW
jgi:hypothetical protein